MADKELATINVSGELASIQLGDVVSGNRVLTRDEIEAKDTVLSDRIDSLESPTSTKYVPQGTAPTYQEGQVYYNDTTGTLDVQGEYSDVILQVGREMHMEVLNNTGATIPNGSIVRHNGVSSGVVQVVLALADDYSTSNILGVATHDIPNATKGAITTFGIVGGIDTSTLPVGTPLYLSPTTPGAFTDIPPDIASQVGGAITSDAQGQLFVTIENHINTPAVIGVMENQTLGNDSYSITSTPQAIINYNTSGNIVIGVDALAGTVTVPKDGFYRVSFNASISFSSDNNTNSISFDIYDKTAATTVKSFSTNIPKDATEDSVSFSPAMLLTEGHEYQIVMSGSNMDITLDEVSYDITSQHIR